MNTLPKRPLVLALAAVATIALALTALVALPSEATTATTTSTPAVERALVDAHERAEHREQLARAAQRRKLEEAHRFNEQVRLLKAIQTNRRAEALRQIARERAAAAQAQAKAKAEEARRRAARPAASYAPGTGRCGGNLPPCCVMNRESRGNIRAQNPHSTASGKWQFLNSTWNGYGGYARAADAPESVQDAKAAQLWAGGAGASHWGGGC